MAQLQVKARYRREPDKRTGSDEQSVQVEDVPPVLIETHRTFGAKRTEQVMAAFQCLASLVVIGVSAERRSSADWQSGVAHSDFLFGLVIVWRSDHVVQTEPDFGQVGHLDYLDGWNRPVRAGVVCFKRSLSV